MQADEQGARLDIAGAYPAEAGAASLVRSLRMEERGILLTDEIILTREAPVTWVFMLRERPHLAAGEARFGRLCLTFDPTLRAEAEEMPVTDARMARNFPGSLWRLTLEAAPAKRLTQNFTITRS